MSQELFNEARCWIAGGVNSPVRAFKAVGGFPIFIERAEGSYLFGSDGRRYIDYVCSWGAMILGHADPKIVAAVSAAAGRGLSYGAPTQLETRLAKLICHHVDSIERVRMVNSGTEAAMSAIRLARGYTVRDVIVKFIGGYHGHVDSLLVDAGSGALTHGVPSSPGIPKSLVRHTLTLDYNNSAQVREIFARRGHEIAAVIVEPVAGNMNCIPAAPEFLATLSELCRDSGSLLIFDEVMSGFRVGLGGAQQRYRVTPDLTLLGKVIGGGLPVGAFGGRAEIMERLAPDGDIYQAGTLSGNPIAMTAGLATLERLAESSFFEILEQRVDRLITGFLDVARSKGVPMTANRAGGMFGLFLTDLPKVCRYDEAMQCDTVRHAKLFHALLEEGVYMAPSAFEAGFISAAHSDADIDFTIQAMARALERL
ncbi:MAG: glutamate-1-semialdehyde 2,1-aminomutase [Candidatus Eutrophobiaceae bacterium]